MLISLTNGRFEAAVSNYGAELQFLRDTKAKIDYLWNGDPAVWSYRAPLLFPFTGKLKDGYINIEGNRHFLPAHGFARTLEHSPVYATDTEVQWELTETPGTLLLYPWRFILKNTYTLRESELSWRTTIINSDTKPIYFSFGTHTAFRCPRLPDENITDYQLEFEKTETRLTRTGINGAGFLSGSTEVLQETGVIPLTEQGFGAGMLLSGFTSSWIGLKSVKTGNLVKMNIKGFPCLTLWQNAGTPRFVCIEPWFGMPDPENTEHEITRKPGIMRLQPKEIFVCDQSIKLKQ